MPEISGKSNSVGGLTRRSFLKTTGAVAGAAVAAGMQGASSLASFPSCVLAEDSQNSTKEEVFHSACVPNCENTCRLKLTVRDGKIVKVGAGDFPNNAYKRICIKGMSHVFRTYHPDRIKYPMHRVGERGSGQWERITWDEAITEITDCWRSLWDKYGKKSILFFNGTGNVGISTCGGVPTKFMNAMDGTKTTGVFDFNAVTGFMRTIGFSFSVFWNQNEIIDVKNAKNLFIWGANMPDSQPHNWHFMKEAQEQGTKIWFIDPKFNIGASKADEYIPIRCGSDTAVLMAMIRIILDQNWIDYDFCRDHTVAPFLVKEDGSFLREEDIGGSGKDYIVIESDTEKETVLGNSSDPVLYGEFAVNGFRVKTALTMLKEAVEEFTPEYAEKLTTVPADKIRELARVYALDGPNTIFTLFGPDRFYNGHFFTHAMATVAGITGNIGKKGASIGEHVLWTYLSGSPKQNSPTGTLATPIASGEAVDVIRTGEYRGKKYPIKSIYACTSNFIGNYSDQNAWIDALTNHSDIDLFVVADFSYTDTVHFADIVLPPTYWFENEDVTGNATHPYAIMQERCIDPLYESKSDSEIINLLADKMGIGEYFKQSSIEYTAEALNGSKLAVQNNITVDRLRTEGVVRCLPGDDDHPFIFAEGGIFPTPTKRLEFYCENPTSLAKDPDFDPSLEHLPRFIPPLEAWPENKLYKKYPLVFLQDHTRWRMHTQWARNPLLRELDPEPIAYLSPQDAKARGIKRGDMIRIFNDRGQVIVKALINKGIPSGIVDCPKGWQRDQYVAAGSFQELTQRKSTPASDNHIQFDVLVEVEPYLRKE